MPKLHLYLHTPVPIFKARINMAAVTYPVGALVYDNVTLGTESDVSFGATLLLGTSEGADDLGRVRVLDVPVSNTIQISHAGKGIEDGLITVQDNAFVTVLDDYRPWAKLPTFDTEDAQDTKDGRIAVGNKLTTEIPPVANGGPGFADYIDPVSGVITVEFPRDGVNTSFTVGDGDTITAHDWDVKDGTITVGVASDPVITATFPAGFRYVVYTATSSNGVSHTVRVPVLAVDPDDDTTIRVFSAKQRLEMSGQSLEITLAEDAPRVDYPDGTLVMFWWDEPATAGSRDHMKFIGWIDNENASVGRNRKGLTRETIITCLDIAGKLRTLPGFPQALSRVEEESPWSYYPSLDMNKSLHYLLHWHSTALDIADFVLPSDGGSYDAMRLDAGGASLFDQVDSQAQKMVPDHYLTCNAAGQLEVRRDWRLDDTGSRPTAAPILTEDNWTDISYSYNRHPKVHVLRSAAILASTAFVEVDGIDTLAVVQSIAPGDAGAIGQGIREQTENEGLALSQEDLNVAEGHRYAMLNHRYGEFSFTDPTGEDFWQYEPASMLRVQLNIAAQYAAQRGLDFTSASGLVKSIDVTYNVSKKGVSVVPKVTWDKETSGYPALTFDPEEGATTPEEPVVLPIPLPGDEDLYYDDIQAYVMWDGEHVFRTMDLSVASPTWELIGTGVTGLIADVQYFHPDEDTVGAWLLSDDGVFICMDLLAGSPSWSHVYDNADLPVTASVPSGFRVGAMAHYWMQPGHLCIMFRPNSASEAVGYISTDFAITEDFGATWTEVSLHDQFVTIEESPDDIYLGYCLVKHNGMAAFRSSPTIYAATYTGRYAGIGRQAVFISEDGGFTWVKGETFGDNSVSDSSAPSITHPFPDTNDPAYVMTGHGTAFLRLYKSTGNWVSASLIDADGVPAAYVGGYAYGNAPQRTNKRTFDENHVMALWVKASTSNGTIAESFDGGATWTELLTGPAGIVIPNGWPPDVQQWVVIIHAQSLGANTIRLTLDNFGTFASKTGNLSALLAGAGESWSTSGYGGGFALPKVTGNL
jgi:hypothetical protein